MDIYSSIALVIWCDLLIYGCNSSRREHKYGVTVSGGAGREQESKCVMGVDINPGCRGAGNPPTYSVVLVCNEKITYKTTQAGLERIVRLAWEYKPAVIAVDNPLELGGSKKSLLKFISLLPDSTSIVQVNLSEEGAKSLYEVAKSSGIAIEGKPTPLRTAYVLAMLAMRGLGVPIVKREERTKIVVRRERRLQHGGTSMDRYKRKVRAAILQIVREIKRELDKNNLDYDLLYRKSGGGLEGAIFTVYAPRSALTGLVKPRRGTSVSVEVKQEYTLSLSPKKQEPERPIIVGVDPGMSTGIAILDTTGKPLLVGTRRSVDRIDIIRLIRQYGRPVIVATDVTPPPETVKKIASLFSALLYVPKESLNVEEKRRIASLIRERYGIEVGDSHSRDALSAAVAAFRSLHNKLVQVESYVKKMSIGIPVEAVKQRVMQGETITGAVEDEIRKLLYETSEPEKRQVTRTAAVSDEEKEQLQKTIDALKMEKARLEEKIRKLTEEIKELREELERTKRRIRYTSVDEELERTIANLKNSLRDLSRKLREANEKIIELEEQEKRMSRTLLLVARGEAMVVIKMPALTKSNLNKLPPNLDKSVVFVENLDSYNTDALSGIAELGIQGVLTRMKPSDRGASSVLRRKGIPVIHVQDSEILWENNDTIILCTSILKRLEEESEKLKRLVEEEERQKLLEMILEYKEKRLASFYRKQSSIT